MGPSPSQEMADIFPLHANPAPSAVPLYPFSAKENTQVTTATPPQSYLMHAYVFMEMEGSYPPPHTHTFSLPPLTRRWQECQSLARDCSSQSFFLSLASSPWCREIMSTGRRFASESDRQTDRQTSGRTDNDSLIRVSCSRGWYFHCVCRQQLCNKCSET